MVLKLVVVLHVASRHCSDNIIPLIQPIFSLIFGFGLFLAHCRRQLCPILASVLDLLDPLFVLLPIVGLSLALDDGTPLV